VRQDDDSGVRCRQRLLHSLNRQAQQLGMTLLPTASAAKAA